MHQERALMMHLHISDHPYLDELDTREYTVPRMLLASSPGRLSSCAVTVPHFRTSAPLRRWISPPCLVSIPY